MDRSSHHSLRPERIANSPYRRPSSNGMKKSSSFASIRSILTYPLNMFRGNSQELTLPTNISDLPAEVETRSESGSEDGWNGQGPAGVNGMDLFDAAAAGGRTGPEFEERQAEWRTKGEVPGGRREMARRSLEGIPAETNHTNPALMPANPFAHLTNGNVQTPANNNKRSRRADTPPTAFTAPTPSFLPPAANTGKSASATALQAIFASKPNASDFTEEDLRVIETLQNALKAEAHQARRAEVGTPGTPRMGGWSAGTPRAGSAVPNSLTGQWEEGTPSRSAQTPSGSRFEVGAATPMSGTPAKKPFSVRYLGPGMSPKRMLGKTKSAGGIKPLFTFNTASEEEESAPKKRKIGEDQSTPAKSISATVSMPNLASIATTATPKVDKGKGRAAPHPLSQSSTVQDERDPVAIGKKRAADFMLALIEEQTAPERAAKANGALTDDIIINPYEFPADTVEVAATPSRYDSPRKTHLRASTSTPKRGAAAKLDASKGRKLSPYERASDMKQWEASASKLKTASNGTERATDSMEVDSVIEPSQTKKTRKSPPPPARTDDVPAVPKRVDFPEPEPFKPFPTPSIETPSRPIASFGSFARSTETFASPSQESALASSTRKDPAPVFSFKPPQPAAPVEDEADRIASRPKEQPRTAVSTFDPTKVYLSAKDTALSIDKAALPFYTFSIPTSAKDDEKTKKAKEQAMKAEITVYTFTMPSPTTSTQVSKTPAPATHGEEQWECDTCMLKNPGSAKEKCTICEAPRPAPKKVAPAASAAPAVSTNSNAQWECDTCMLKNPESAKEKCTICEAPRPAKTKVAASNPTTTQVNVTAPAPFQWPGGIAPQKKEGWTCGTCMCSSPESASKCVVCEMPR